MANVINMAKEKIEFNIKSYFIKKNLFIKSNNYCFFINNFFIL
jgi:hypothetical protein